MRKKYVKVEVTEKESEYKEKISHIWFFKIHETRYTSRRTVEQKSKLIKDKLLIIEKGAIKVLSLMKDSVMPLHLTIYKN